MHITVYCRGKKTSVEARSGDNLARTLVGAGLLAGVECGRGQCGKCAVKLVSGKINPLVPNEDITKNLPDGCILSCRCLVGDEDIVIETAKNAAPAFNKAMLPGLGENTLSRRPLVKKFFLELPIPSENDRQADLERVLSALDGEISFNPDILHDLPSILRESGFKITAVLIDDKLVKMEPGDTSAENYGIAIDLGTTSIAVYLVDINSGKVIDAMALANPQRSSGADVLSRIAACGNDEIRQAMQIKTVAETNVAIETLLGKNGINEDRIYHIVVVGNTTMSHLFLGLDPQNIAIAPFIPCFRSRISLPACELGYSICPNARIDILANISAHVGSDALGVAIATRAWEKEGFSLAVDIGTNGEILLVGNGKFWSCSAAAGPAFEGAHISCGMRAGEGAIEKIIFRGGKIIPGIIGNGPPKGLCGSGLIDGIAELLKAGILLSTGNFINDMPLDYNKIRYFNRIRIGEKGVREFVLVNKGEYGSDRDIVITQKDIRELQLAKAAIAAGIEILFREAEITADQVERVYLAGAFGNYLDKVNALTIGLIPGISREKIISAGNAAADGAIRCLLSKDDLEESDIMAVSIQATDLSGRKDFNDIWLKFLDFPENSRQ